MKRRKLDTEPDMLELDATDVNAAFRTVKKWFPVQPLDKVKDGGVDASMQHAFPFLNPTIHSLSMAPRIDGTRGLPVAIHNYNDTSGSLRLGVTLDDPLCVPTAAIEADFATPLRGSGFFPLVVRPALVHRRDSQGVSQHHALVLPLGDVYQQRDANDAKELWKTLVRDWHFDLELVVEMGTAVYIGHTPVVVQADSDDVDLHDMD